MFLVATGSAIPADRVTTAAAVRQGVLPQAIADLAQTESVRVSPQAAVELGARAGRMALARSGIEPGRVGLLLHASTYHQGHDLWPAASYLQREVLANACSAVEIRQMSNGALAGLDLASSHLTAHPDDAVLLTAADRFAPPGIDRWLTDPGSPYGDGAGAVLVSGRGGFARVRALALHADPSLEPLHRGTDAFTPGPFAAGRPVDFTPSKQSFLAAEGAARVAVRTAAGQREVVDKALAEAGVEMRDIDWFLLPHFGLRRLMSIYVRPYDIDLARTTWAWNRTIGHLGAADPLAGLDHLAATGALRPGRLLAMISVGAGYTWGCAILEILGEPPAADQQAA